MSACLCLTCAETATLGYYYKDLVYYLVIYMYMCVCMCVSLSFSVYVCMYVGEYRYPKRLEEGDRSPRAETTDDCKLPKCGCWKLNLGPLQYLQELHHLSSPIIIIIMITALGLFGKGKAQPFRLYPFPHVLVPKVAKKLQCRGKFRDRLKLKSGTFCDLPLFWGS